VPHRGRLFACAFARLTALERAEKRRVERISRPVETLTGLDPGADLDQTITLSDHHLKDATG